MKHLYENINVKNKMYLSIKMKLHYHRISFKKEILLCEMTFGRV